MKKRRGPIDPRILKEVEQHLRIHPNYPDFQNQLGLVRVKEGKPEEGEACFQEALRLNPDYREPLVNLGCLYMECQRWHEAEGLLRSNVRKYSQDGFYQHLLGVLYFTLGKPREAAVRVRRAIRLLPVYRGYYGRLGLWQRGTVAHYPGGLAFLRKVPSHHLEANFHNFIGLHLAKAGRFNRAARELQRAAKIEPNASLFHFNLGFLHYLRGHYGAAVHEFRKGLKIDPGYGIGYAHLSYTYGAMGHLGRAVQSFERAVQLNPTYADFHYGLALLYGARRRHEEAIAELKKALRINPNYLFARINLGVVYEDMNQRGAARREYRKVLRITPEDENVRKRLERIS